MSRYGSYSGWYPPAPKRRPADGIRATSQRGSIGETWWSKRFLQVLETFGMGSRLTRGRSYARTGQVLAIEVRPGEVTSRVQGSRSKPYKVSIRLLPLPDKDWTMVEHVMGERAVFMAKLLAGEMPHEIEEAFSSCRINLFPASPRDLATDCSCPDWANPCKHIAATFYLLAETFDNDPFLIFQWRGRTKEELIARLIARSETVPQRPSTSSNGALWPELPAGNCESLEDSMANFFEMREKFDGVHFSLDDQTVHSSILDELGESPFSMAGIPTTELLRPAYDAMAEAVAKYLSGSMPDLSPAPLSEGGEFSPD